jgi:hypothetical protein
MDSKWPMSSRHIWARCPIRRAFFGVPDVSSPSVMESFRCIQEDRWPVTAALNERIATVGASWIPSLMRFPGMTRESAHWRGQMCKTEAHDPDLDFEAWRPAIFSGSISFRSPSPVPQNIRCGSPSPDRTPHLQVAQESLRSLAGPGKSCGLSPSDLLP